jgi:hypothetical protein
MKINYDEIKKSTEKARLIVFGDDVVWVPKSIIEDITESTIILPEWFIIENELEIYTI